MIDLEIQLCYDKLSGNSELSWEEIKESANFEHSVAHLKNLAYGYKRLIDSGYLGMVNEDTENDEKLLEIRKEIMKLATLKSELNKNLRKDARDELFFEQISDVIQRLEPPKYQMIPELPDNDKEYILHMSDIHYGSEFEVEGNSYNIKTCEERLFTLLSRVITKVKRDNIQRIKVVNTGDSIQGMLRLSDVKKNELPVVESIVGFSRLMSEFLNNLSEYVNVEYYHITSANHSEPRFIGTQAGAMPEEDFEKVIMSYIKDVLSDNERVYVHTDMTKPYIEMNIYGYEFICMHGHTVKSIDNAIRDLSMTNKKFYNYLLMGHVHHTNIKETDSDCMVLVAPSFVGVCPYSKKILKTSNPGATMYTIEDGYGLTDIKLFNLARIKNAS
ncbi:MAG TPA: hypothetical protein DCW90_06115 [Lachnospiraceae bacterium]|nr:hypothetical protein [uncultured Lachnoclostridium sp.]HAU85072.1 hypothetical protein [Lachnospiraceae bacterium]